MTIIAGIDIEDNYRSLWESDRGNLYGMYDSISSSHTDAHRNHQSRSRTSLYFDIDYEAQSQPHSDSGPPTKVVRKESRIHWEALAR